MLEAVWKVTSLEACMVNAQIRGTRSPCGQRGSGNATRSEEGHEGRVFQAETVGTRLKGMCMVESGNSTSVRLEYGKRGNKPMDGNENLPGVSGRQEQSNLGQRKG